MKRISAAFIAFVLATSLSCATIQPMTPTGDEIVDCAKEAARDIYFTLLPRVSTIIAQGPTLAVVTVELAKLTAEYGVDVVTCVVHTVQDRNASAAAAATGDERALHERSVQLASDWLAEHGKPIKGE